MIIYLLGILTGIPLGILGVIVYSLKLKLDWERKQGR